MKKVVSLLLVLVLALGMSTVAFAAADINKNPSNADDGFSNVDGSTYGGDVFPGKKEVMPIDQSMFASEGQNTTGDKGSWVATSGDLITKADVDKTRLTVRTKIQKGPTALKEYGIEYSRDTDGAGVRHNKVASVYWEYVKPFKFNDLDGLDFDFTIYPVVDGRAWTELGVQITGTLYNPNEQIDADTYYIDMEPGTIGECVEYAKSVEYDLGEGVSVFGRAIKGANYWGVANKDATVREDEMMTEKGIDEVYHLENIGLAGVANKVVLNDADPSSYVFDKNFKYLGKAGDELPFSDTYYLSDVMLDEDDDVEPDDDDLFDDDDIPVAPPITGGDGYPVENENDNPSTGK